MSSLRRRSVLMGLLSMPIAVSAANGADYPTRAIEFVVASTAGGIVDAQARKIGEKLSVRLGQPVVIVNKAGGGGTIATLDVRKAPADGYTIFLGANSTMVSNMYLYPDLKLNPPAEFVPIHGVAGTPITIVSNASRPYKTMKELLAYAKDNPGKVKVSALGVGSATDLIAALVQQRAGVKFTMVPYPGGSAALNDLVAGNIDVSFNFLVSVLPLVKDGKLNALGITTPERLPAGPDVPAISESGITGLEIQTWTGVFARAGTPQAIVDRLSKELTAVLAEKDMQDFLINSGSTTMVDMDHKAFSTFYTNDIPRWKSLIELVEAAQKK